MSFSMSQKLDSKELSLFRQVIKYSDEKNYKRGIRIADQVLKKYPRHGATMAMKALMQSNQGKMDEAFALAKDALTCDMKAGLCWQVYALLWRTTKNYEEAIKAYKFALRIEPDSVPMQRDLAQLQIQMRDHAGFAQTRMLMLQGRPGGYINWSALAIAYHLGGDPARAENIITTYEGTLKQAPAQGDLEHAELIMYKNLLIAEQGDYERALEHLDTGAGGNLDQLAVLEYRALYLERLGRKAEAGRAYRALLARNAEKQSYYDGLVRVLGIPDDDELKLKEVYDEWASRSPRCEAARRLPLNFLTGDAFRQAGRDYLTPKLDKAVPSTFASLKHLYADSAKKEILLGLVEEYLARCDDDGDGGFEKEKVEGDTGGGEAEGDRADRTKSKAGKAAALYYLAQHHNYRLSRDLGRATGYIEQALEIAPRNTEYHMTNARIIKHGGDLVRAAEAMDRAREQDPRDRGINSKAAKYHLRNNDNDRAIAVAGMFTRGDAPGGPMGDLYEMQCIWYLTEDGEAHERRDRFGLALKRFHAVQAIYELWQDDQFDFHTWILRKGQLRAYVDMLKWEDSLHQHPTYTRAGLEAVAIYLKLHDRTVEAAAAASQAAQDRSETNGGESARERRRAAKQARREQQQLIDKMANQGLDGGSGGGGSGSNNNGGTERQQQQQSDDKKVDDDPLGLKLAGTKDHLEEAIKFLGPMLQFSPRVTECQLIGFEVFVRRKKYLLALRCLNAARALDPENAQLCEQAIRLRHAIGTATADAPLDPKVSEVLAAEFESPGPSADLGEEIAGFRDKSPAHLLAAIRAGRAIGLVERAAAEQQLIDMIGMDGMVRFEDGFPVVETLREWGVAKEVMDAAKRKGADRWAGVTRYVE